MSISLKNGFSPSAERIETLESSVSLGALVPVCIARTDTICILPSCALHISWLGVRLQRLRGGIQIGEGVRGRAPL